MKNCKICGKNQELNCFRLYKKNNSISRTCKSCNKISTKQYKQNNKDKIKKSMKEYRLKNKIIIKEKNKIYRQNNVETCRNSAKNYQRKLRKENIEFRLKSNISRAIKFYLSKIGCSKERKSLRNYFAYTMQELKDHIESQFDPWMNWNNHGSYRKTWNDEDQSTWTWQIDHIIPHSTFEYTSMEDNTFLKCWSLDNLRPLSAKQNLLDGNRRS